MSDHLLALDLKFSAQPLAQAGNEGGGERTCKSLSVPEGEHALPASRQLAIDFN